ncbi:MULTISPECIES: hypothetical protein [Mycobacteriaceae]|uniref:Uncharacterized protein n=1 Tax=Mycolicibacterium parafortuitum TaxID=39692 RepID=A0ACC6MK59_MYCPF|nr:MULTISPECIES: hypothetical protein [Mycobacteriaceae]MDZ5087377.1 hypothetical protein [Mycolicibacterium parafortuitum]GFM19364.1 STAS domain-containing protein [Mycobacterium sp. PO1]GFM22918.1 STAS domain-containing protein [Mycobacterium sp. PO2]
MSIGRRTASPLGYVVECRGAWVRAQIRSVATIVTVTGCVEGTNVQLVADYVGRFTTLDTPLIVDLQEAGSGQRRSVDRLVTEFAKRCNERNIDWVLVAGVGTESLSDLESVQRAASVADALEHFVRVISARRRLPLHRLRTAPPPESGLTPLRTGS